MQSKAQTVEQYLAELPEDRRAAIEAVRKVILKNLDKGFEECIGYGMIGYVVPKSKYPPGYHCDPTKPLPFANLASQKGHMALYLMTLYTSEDGSFRKWFMEAWAKSGSKLDAGKSCIRFKKVEELPLGVIGEAIKRVKATEYIRHFEAIVAKADAEKAAAKAAKKAAAKSATKVPAKPAAKRAAKPTATNGKKR